MTVLRAALKHRPHLARGAGVRALAALGLALALWGLARPAHADLWAFVDERGITHFAAEALDERYRRSEEHTSELQSPCNIVCRLLLEKKKTSVRFLDLLLHNYPFDFLVFR